MARQSGFTFTEIIAVTVVLGLLGVVAVPRITDLRQESSQASVRSIAGAIESNSTRNHAIDLAVEEGLTTAITDPFINIASCQDGKYLVDVEKLPDGYKILPVDVSDQVAVTCTLVSGSGTKSNFVIIGAAGGINKSN